MNFITIISTLAALVTIGVGIATALYYRRVDPKATNRILGITVAALIIIVICALLLSQVIGPSNGQQANGGVQSSVATSPASGIGNPVSGCRQGFSDEFDTSLNPGWSWASPNGSAAYGVTGRPGFLSISAPSGVDLSINSNQDAPRLLQPVSDDFVAETLLEFDPPYSSYQGAGILIWDNGSNYVRIERSYGGDGHNGMRLEKIEGGTSTIVSTSADNPTMATIVSLRVQRRGDQFTVWWRQPSDSWQFLGATTQHYDSPMIGLFVINQSSDGQREADFDYFHISCPG